MTQTTNWLLAGAALALLTAGGVAYGDERQAQQQAAQDAAPSAARPDGVDWPRFERGDNREIRIYRERDGDRDVTIINSGREQNLSALLQLRPEQQPALRAFLEATRPSHNGDREQRLRIDGQTEGRTTLQRLDEMQARATAQQAEMSRKMAAIRTFYAQLDAKQQKAFDALPMLMVAAPSIGPMMLPRPLPIARHMPLPPEPPVPPAPPFS